MSMHRIPLTDLERRGLEAHGLEIGTPSQLSDVFRQGVEWALKYGKIPEIIDTPDRAYLANRDIPHLQQVLRNQYQQAKDDSTRIELGTAQGYVSHLARVLLPK